MPYPGDANHDFQFDQLDLVQVLHAGKYLTDIPVDWSEGDWNGDLVFDELDLVAALQADRYAQRPYATLVERTRPRSLASCVIGNRQSEIEAVDQLLEDDSVVADLSRVRWP